MQSRIYLILKLFFLFCVLGTAQAEVTIPAIHVPAPYAKPDVLSTATKIIITHQEITESGMNNLTQILQALGGLQFHDTSSNNTQPSISMRGFGDNASSNTLILLNGVPLTNPDLASPALNTIPIQDIDYIEMNLGSEGVLNGDQAVGGTINIVTHLRKDPKITLACSAGSYSEKDCDLLLSHKINNLAYQFDLISQHTDNYREHNIYQQNGVAGQLEYPFATGSFNVDYTLYNEHLQYPGALTAAEVTENRRQANNDTDFFNDSNGFFHLKQRQNLNSHWRLETDLMHREMTGNGVLYSPFKQSRTINYIKPQLKGSYGPLFLNGGIEAEVDDYHLISTYGETIDTEQKYSFFGLSRYAINSKFTLLAGAREATLANVLKDPEDFNTLNRVFITTIESDYQFTPTIQWFLRRAGSYRFPKSDENAYTPPGINGLKTQKGYSYETGIKAKSERVSSKLSVYELYLNNEIAYDPTQTAERPFGSNTNLDPTKRIGLSLAETLQVSPKIRLEGKYNYVYAHFDEGIYSGNRIPLVAENTLDLGANYQIKPHWGIFADGIYTGNEFSANDNANVTTPLGGYTYYNINLTYKNQQLKANFRINNLFNKYYYSYTVYEPGMSEEFYYPAAGRSFVLSLNYSFI